MPAIPNTVISCIADIFSEHYSHAELNNLFFAAGVDVNDIPGSKLNKIQQGLDRINGQSQTPIATLGVFLEGYMDSTLERGFSESDEAWNERQRSFNGSRSAIKESLRTGGYIYQTGGVIAPLSAQPVLDLKEKIRREGLSAVNSEIERAIADLQSGDYSSAVHHSGALLEAVYKTYLDKNNKPYQANDTAHNLWQAVAAHLNLRPGNQLNEQLRKIASSLYQISAAAAELRNQTAHGEDKEQYRRNQNITAAQAELAVNAAAALSAYILTA